MWAIEPFREDHETLGFDCGDPSLDSWLKDRALAWSKQGLARAYVAVERGASVVIGYYTLSSHHVTYDALPQRDQRGLPRIHVPAVLLGRLAVDRSAQGKRLGAALLSNAMARTLKLADATDAAIGIRVFEVEAYESARGFYLHHGFRPLEDDRNHLFLSLKEMRRLQRDGDLPALP